MGPYVTDVKCKFAYNLCFQVVEAVYENLDLKKQIFSRLENICRPDTVLCSNTSYISIDKVCIILYSLVRNNIPALKWL